MTNIANKAKLAVLIGAMALPIGAVSAQDSGEVGENIDVYGERMQDGPTIEGVISARRDNQMQVTATDGTSTVITLDDNTEIRGKGGFLGLGSKDRAADALLNGLPVTVETKRLGTELIASEVDFKNKDQEVAAMIRSGTAQGFAEQTAATDALRNRVADIDQYNVKGTTNVFFDTGKYQLSDNAEANLCNAAAEAESMDNALLLVVGYTDSTGDYDFNQELSEKRASRVVNYLQQACGWKPYRMLTPTGMAEADPLADNETEAGKAQNRRVAVNILVSKSVDGL